ncbi:DGQHR domain-containing protein [Stenotrophomonas sp. NLF4-10]|uniref:DGQHR domain-containing protein n=1 Tax=Stenotrophomonas sp. NLF4-10 TaxID=2918754 RepID=UPI001EFB0B3C|nr:DGQHR domain-containing protein [Stenotrophomonas sp. NLF4-10]MCG8276385.1 DGQHR domain-containing protein [Stenotrophomonas sp. NLF4-10]
MPRQIRVPAIKVRQGDREFYLAALKARQLVSISYVAIRGVDDEEGAVQRIFNRDRLASLRKFALTEGSYPSTIVLNWTAAARPVFDDGELKLDEASRSAQIIDGQHRVEGLRAALEEKDDLGDLEVPVSIYVGLNTRACADIFLSINTEQRPVPRSLVFDLFGEASDVVVDAAAVRARDIAMALNNLEESPYYQNIKMPNQPIRKGGIALSTAVSALKPLVEDKGIFEQIDAYELGVQQRIVLNFFVALSSRYGSYWNEKTNAFQFAAGFIGAVDFLKLKIIPACNALNPRDFSVENISNMLTISAENRIRQEELKGFGGKDAPRIVFDRLVASMRAIPANSAALKL